MKKEAFVKLGMEKLAKKSETSPRSRLENSIDKGLKGADVGFKHGGYLGALLGYGLSEKDDPLLFNKMVHGGMMGGGAGAAIGGTLGAGAGALQSQNKEKIAADYINLKKNKRTGEFGTKGHNLKLDSKHYGKKVAPGLAGAGLSGLAANKLTKDKDKKTRNTLFGAAAGGTIGELARRMKTSSDKAYTTEPETGKTYKRFGLSEEDARSMNDELRKYRHPWEIEEAKKRKQRMEKYMNTLGDGSLKNIMKTMGLQYSDKIKDNKKPIAATLGAGAAGFGLGRLSKKANLAELTQRNENVVRHLPPRAEEQPTEAFKRLLRKYKRNE